MFRSGHWADGAGAHFSALPCESPRGGTVPGAGWAPLWEGGSRSLRMRAGDRAGVTREFPTNWARGVMCKKVYPFSNEVVDKTVFFYVHLHL